MVKHIPSLHPDYRECILDIDIFGRIVSAPQLSYEQLKEMLFEEYAQRTPMPTLETKRYELSRPVSDNYKVSYGGDIELQDNESLVDLQSKSSGVVFEDLSSLIPGNIHSEVQELFRYEYGAHDDFRQRIIDEYDVESLEEFKPGVRATENIVGSTSEDESLVLSDEAVERLGEEPEEEGQLAESGDDDVPSWMQGVMAYGQVDDSDTDTEENGDMSVADDEQEQMPSDDDDYDVYAGYDDEVVEGSEGSGGSDDSGGDAEGDSEDYVDVYGEEAEEGYTDVYAEDSDEEVAEEGYTDVYAEGSEDSDGDYVDVYAEDSEGDDTSQAGSEEEQGDIGGQEFGVVPADDSGVVDDDGVDFGDMTPDDLQVDDSDDGVDYGDVDSDDGVDFGDMDAEGEEEAEEDYEQSDVDVAGSDDDDVYFGDVEEEQDDGVDFGDIQEKEQEYDASREEVEEETYREEATETFSPGWPSAGGSESGQFGEDDGVDFIDDLDDGIDFVDTPKSGGISSNSGVVQPPVWPTPQKPVPVARPSPEQEFDRSSEPTDIRAFVRKHPRCEVQFALKFFTKKQIDDAVRLGRIIKKGNTLR